MAGTEERDFPQVEKLCRTIEELEQALVEGWTFSRPIEVRHMTANGSEWFDVYIVTRPPPF